MQQTPITEVFKFLDYTVNKNFLNTNTAGSRKTACKNLFDVLDENEKTVEYVAKNLDSVVHRFGIKNKDKFTGQTIEVYKSRVKNTLDDFDSWTTDKAGWERNVIGRSKTSSAKPKEEKPSAGKGKQSGARRPEAAAPAEEATYSSGKATRKLSFPIRPDFEAKVEIPMDGLTSAELRRLGLFLLPYCNDLSSENMNPAEWGALVRQDKKH